MSSTLPRARGYSECHRAYKFISYASSFCVPALYQNNKATHTAPFTSFTSTGTLFADSEDGVCVSSFSHKKCLPAPSYDTFLLDLIGDAQIHYKCTGTRRMTDAVDGHTPTVEHIEAPYWFPNPPTILYPIVYARNSQHLHGNGQRHPAKANSLSFRYHNEVDH